MKTEFEHKFSDPKTDAQTNLQGLTHYVDKDTLHYFNSKILSCAPLGENRFFYVVETLQGPGSKRIKRISLFDLLGTNMVQFEGSVSIKTEKLIEQVVDYLSTINIKDYYRAKLVEKRRRDNFEIEQFEKELGL